MILTSLPMTPLYIIVANAPLGRYGDVYCAIIFILQYSIYGVIIGWVVGAVKKHRQKNLQSKSNVQTFKK